MRWRVLALLFLARVGAGLQFQTLGSVGGDLSAAFGITYAEFGLLVGLFMAPGLVLSIPAGFSGRFASDKVLAAIGMALLAIGGVVAAWANQSAVIGIGRVLAGAGFLFATLYLTKMVVDWFSGKEIATAMSLFVMSWPLGVAVGQVSHVWIAEIASWRWAFLWASTYCLIACVALLLLYRVPDGQDAAPVPARTRLSARAWRLVLLAGLAWGLFNAGYVVFLSFGPPLLESLGQSPLQAAGIISVASWIMVFSGAICGLIVDRTGRQTLAVSLCIGLGCVALLLLPVDGFALLASVLFGLFGIAPAGVIMALAGQALAPAERAFGLGIFFTVYYAAMVASPPIAGALFDSTGQATAPIWWGLAIFAVVLPIYLAFRWIAARPAPA